MNAFKDITGLTHDEMATVLGVHRSQWSMYVSGKRSLPLEATIKLNELLQSIQKNKVNKAHRAVLVTENKSVIQAWQKKLTDLNINLFQVNKKIEEMQKTRNQLYAGLTTLAFLKAQKEHNVVHLQSIEKRINKCLATHSLECLTTLEMKKQQIENEISIIEEKLENKN
ncbi:XRE family transcriptional regulator [Flavobacterium piscinae]|uniref:XRE family transcriptional regulator n=1 Tax=Flavobacterium piscinae TaxID=2506424 RepID=A0A4Q1KYG8_9FLAO|nr:helix-turn-helix transcriptional regulator [Flavobacterium piscinae]RXR35423.1 XRE family transcriptional regulator [Flavobacterium piscinae]